MWVQAGGELYGRSNWPSLIPGNAADRDALVSDGGRTGYGWLSRCVKSGNLGSYLNGGHGSTVISQWTGGLLASNVLAYSPRTCLFEIERTTRVSVQRCRRLWLAMIPSSRRSW